MLNLLVAEFCIIFFVFGEKKAYPPPLYQNIIWIHRLKKLSTIKIGYHEILLVAIQSI